MNTITNQIKNRSVFTKNGAYLKPNDILYTSQYDLQTALACQFSKRKKMYQN